MKPKSIMICFLTSLLGLYGCNLEPEVAPSISVDYILMKRLGMTSNYLDVYNLFGEATLKPEGKNVIEAGFMYSDFYDLTVNNVTSGRNGIKIPCEIKDNKISFNLESDNICTLTPGVTYCLAYMILQDGSAVASQTYRVSTGDVVGDIEITTGPAENIEYNQATLTGQIELSGNVTLKEYGFYLGTMPNPTSILTPKAGFTGNKLDLAIIADKLDPNTTYYYIAYGIDSKGNIVKGEERSFTTKVEPFISIDKLTLTDLGVISSFSHRYNLKGTATLHLGENKVAEAGFLYSASPSLRPSDVMYSNIATRVPCEVVNDQISMDVDISDNNGNYYSTTYILAYMILENGTLIVTDIQSVSSY